MKRIVKLLPLALLFVVSCKPETITYTSYHSSAAKFSIVNLTTCDTIHNGEIAHVETDTFWIDPNPNSIIVRPDDILKVIYQPPQKFEKTIFRVDFKGSGSGWNWNHCIYGKKPFETEISIKRDSGVYIFNCDAKSDDWLEGSSDYGILQVTIVDADSN